MCIVYGEGAKGRLYMPFRTLVQEDSLLIAEGTVLLVRAAK